MVVDNRCQAGETNVSSLENRNPTMPEPHDVGGLDLGAIDQMPHDPTIFERRVDAMVRFLIRDRQLFTTDALRRSVEDLPAAAYVGLSYYERWLHGLTALLLESGSLTETQLDSRRADVAQRMAVAYDGSGDQDAKHGSAATSHADHAAIEHDHQPPNEHEVLGEAIRELGIETGLFSGADIHRLIEQVEASVPTHGPRLVARAWTDPDFMNAVIDDARAAANLLGVDLTDTTALQAVVNTTDTHHLVVCTLCSCYPRALLGLPPAWYKSREYRARAVKDPRGVLAEFGTILPETTHIKTVDSTADLRYFVIPQRPGGTDGMDAGDLEALVSRDSMIGVATALSPLG
jgi:nitrile hydratase